VPAAAQGHLGLLHRRSRPKVFSAGEVCSLPPPVCQCLQFSLRPTLLRAHQFWAPIFSVARASGFSAHTFVSAQVFSPVRSARVGCCDFEFFDFVCAVIELLQGVLGIALESPDQKTRGFVV
jgi:hypothetical protein